MKKIKFIILIFTLLITSKSIAQKADSSSFTFSGYVDAYVAYYNDSVGIGNYQKFPSVSPRSENFGLNVASITAKYNSENVRGMVTFHYGDIPRSAWSGNYNYIQEANAGIRITKKLWLDGGFFRTHVGTEGLFPKENITSSVAVATYFEPYYEAGFKFNYTATDKLTINLFLLNGYNLYEDNNKKKSVGVLATYAITDKISVGYNNYLGDDSPEGDTISRMHLYSNAFLYFEKNKIKIVTGVDFCIQENADLKNGKKSASMFSGVFNMRYAAATKCGVYARAEFFNDANGFISGVFIDNKNKLTGLKLFGATFGVEYKPTDNSYFRIEARNLMAEKNQEIFWWKNNSKNSRMEVMLNFGVSFQ